MSSEQDIEIGLDTVEIVIWAEKEFDVTLPDEEVGKIFTVGEFARYIAKRSNTQNNTSWNYQDTLPAIIDILVSDFDVKREHINTTSKFVDDLGLG